MQRTQIHYVMTLFVTGVTVRSGRAVVNIRDFCEQDLHGDYELEVVDLYRSPERARSDQIVAAPTLIRHEPKPARRVIGDMSDRHRLQDVIKVA